MTTSVKTTEAPTLNFVSTEAGIVYFTINTGSKVFDRKLKENGMFTRRGWLYQFDGENTITQIREEDAAGTKTFVPVAPAKPMRPIQSEFSINQRFGFLEKFTEMVLDGETASEIVTGEGGLGKSHTVMEALRKKGLKEVEFTTVETKDVDDEGNTVTNVESKYVGDYKVVKGYATPKALYATLYENSDKIIVFDDCDSVLKDPTAVNILKGALDSYDRRTISWLSRGFIDDGLPSSFDFEGQVIFISNLSIDKVDQAVKSRSMVIDLSMTLEDKIERMQTILPDVMEDYDMDLKQQALDFMSEHKEEAVEFNMRTLQKIIKVAHAYDVTNPEWKNAAKYLLTNV